MRIFKLGPCLFLSALLLTMSFDSLLAQNLDVSWLEGTWEGTGVQTNEQSWPIKLTVSGHRYLIEYPSLGCRGEWVLSRKDSESATFVERVDANSTKCMDAGNVLIEKLNGEQIKFSYSPNNTATIIATATLQKITFPQALSDAPKTPKQSTARGLEGTVWEGIQADERYSPELDETVVRRFYNFSFQRQGRLSCDVRVEALSRVKRERVLDPLTQEFRYEQKLIPGHLLFWQKGIIGKYELDDDHLHIDFSAYEIDATVEGNNMKGEITLKRESDQKARWVASRRNAEEQ
ncbi:MAG: hypothetical protein JWM21_3536 [Acidobacteria bacterium]|nr:hypothetical protein [Acidobacteriota bacterium]